MSKKPAKKSSSDTVFSLDAIYKDLEKIGGRVPLRDLNQVQFISSGITLLDAILRPYYAESGCSGGYIGGTIVELSGDTMTGKSALIHMAIASAQKAGGRADLFDIENKFRPTRAELCGVDVGENKLAVWRPDTLDATFTAIESMVSTYLEYAAKCAKIGVVPVPYIIAIDSVAQLGTESTASVETDSDGKLKSNPRAASAHWTEFFRKPWVRQLGQVPNCGLVFMTTNQLRVGQQASSYIPPQPTTPGGWIHKYAGTTRIRTRSAKLRDSDSKHDRKGAPSGVNLWFKSLKCEGAPMRECSVPWFYHRGFDDHLSCLHYLTDFKIVKAAAGYVSIGNKRGTKESLCALARKDKKFSELIRQMAYDAYCDINYYQDEDSYEQVTDSDEEDLLDEE